MSETIDPNAHINPVLRSIAAKQHLRPVVDPNGTPRGYGRQTEQYRAAVTREQHEAAWGVRDDG
jgi:hypothetical protein